MFIQLPLPHVRDSPKGLGKVRSQLCTPLSFTIQKGMRYSAEIPCSVPVVTWKCLEKYSLQETPRLLSCGKERGKEDGELFFSLAYI